MGTKCGPVTVTTTDGTTTVVPALRNAAEVMLAGLPKKRKAKLELPSDTGRSDGYEFYLRSPAWKRRKDEYYSTHAKRCSACGSKKHIHLHHLTYARLGAERDSDLTPLCYGCHEKVHQLHADGFASLMRVTRDYVATTAAGRSRVRRQERQDAARGVGERKPGERRHRPCGPKQEKPSFIPRNRRGATLDENGRVIAAERGDDAPTWASTSLL